MCPLFNGTTTYTNTKFVIFQFLQENVWLVHWNRLQLFPPTFDLVLHAAATSYLYVSLKTICHSYMICWFFVQNFLSSDHGLEMGHPHQAKLWFSSFLHSSFKTILIFGTVKTL